jgi:hypothetical protein
MRLRVFHADFRKYQFPIAAQAASADAPRYPSRLLLPVWNSWATRFDNVAPVAGLQHLSPFSRPSSVAHIDFQAIHSRWLIVLRIPTTLVDGSVSLALFVGIQIISRKPHAPTGLNGWVGFQNKAVCKRPCLPDHPGVPGTQAMLVELQNRAQPTRR